MKTRNKMAQALALRNFSESTRTVYMRAAKRFVRKSSPNLVVTGTESVDSLRRGQNLLSEQVVADGVAAKEISASGEA